MNAQIDKTIKEILAEIEQPLISMETVKAGITPENFEALKQIVADGYETQFLKTLVGEKSVQDKIYAEKIYDVFFDKESATMLKLYQTRKGSAPNSAKQLDNADPKAQSIAAHFKFDYVDGVVLLANNAVAVYRRGLQFPSVIWCHNAEEAKDLYNRIKKGAE